MEDLDIFEENERKRFLGPEFLLWLWFRSDRNDGLLTAGDEDIELFFDDQLILEAHLAEAEQSRLKGGAPAYSPEAYQALQQGKRVAKAKLRIVKDTREWVFKVEAETFSFSTVKIPSVLSDEDFEKFLERMYLLEELDSLWALLYQDFLEIRLSDDWKQEREQIVEWIAKPVADV
jgi:hypothetical protein